MRFYGISRLIIPFVIFLVYFINDINSIGFIDSNKYKIGVCISGQLARFLPETTVTHLIHPNSQQFHFTFFLNLQYSTKNSSSIYSTDPDIAFQPSKYLSMKQNDVLHAFHELYDLKESSSLGSVTFVPPKTLIEWEKNVFRGEKADRIVQYADMQHVILNFHEHQVRCYHQIVEYEQLYNSSFDYILSTREDVIYFSSVNLTYLINHFKKSKGKPVNAEGASSSTFSSLDGTTQSVKTEDTKGTSDSQSERKCEFISKECLAWAGINMRWQFMTRDVTSLVLGSRLIFYRYLMSSKKTAYNPEQFELAQLNHYEINRCDFVADIIPNIVARHVSDDHYCFLKPETLDNCVPHANLSYVHQNFCHRVNKKFRNTINP
jgi:hypothetical protein